MFFTDTTTKQKKDLNMTLYYLELLTIFTGMIWFDFLGAHRWLLEKLGYQAWMDKHDLPIYWGWVACYFCTMCWLGIISGSVYTLITLDWISGGTFIIQNAIVARILDSLMGYESMKAK